MAAIDLIWPVLWAQLDRAQVRLRLEPPRQKTSNETRCTERTGGGQ
jgi:hypothetical protein